jgi:hypothetical protein
MAHVLAQALGLVIQDIMLTLQLVHVRNAPLDAKIESYQPLHVSLVGPSLSTISLTGRRIPALHNALQTHITIHLQIPVRLAILSAKLAPRTPLQPANLALKHQEANSCI